MKYMEDSLSLSRVSYLNIQLFLVPQRETAWIFQESEEIGRNKYMANPMLSTVVIII